MNAGVRKLFWLVLVLFTLLFIGTARWSVIEADQLNAHSRNARPQLETARVPRGTIRSADGTLLARSVKQDDGTYVRRYTEAAKQAAQLIGYAYTNAGRAGLEKQYHDDLTGKVRSAATLLSALRGSNEKGNDVIATLDTGVQQAALGGLAGRRGAAVAIDTRTGALLAMASTPTFDPNDMRSDETRKRIAAIADSPRLNRATGAAYPPASTFKTVTAAAALATGKYTPQSMIDGSSPMTVETRPLQNFGGKSFGDISLTSALTFSVNTAFARVGEDIGPGPIDDMMGELGFGEEPSIDFPDDQLRISGRRVGGKLVDVDGRADVGRVAIGQEKLEVTPLQMAIVAATIARGGDRPHIATVQRVIDPDGRTLSSLGDGKSAGRAMAQRDAAQLTAMMEQVVNEGSGEAAALRGLRVAGKTGTGERDGAGDINQPWFIGFAPADNPRVAVAVTLEAVPGGTGGVTAAPIAKAMMEAAL